MLKAILPMLLVGLAGLSYVDYRLYVALPLPVWAKVVAVVLQSAIILSYIWFMLIGNQNLSYPLAKGLNVLGGASIIIFLYLVMAWLVVDITSLVFPSIRAYFTDSWSGLIGMVVVLVGIFSYGNYKFHVKERISLTLQLNKPLPRPLKIVGISDLHLGYGIGRQELAGWIDRINAEHPDLVLIAGDIVDFSTRPLWKEGMAEEFHRLKAPLGVYTIMGNHEYMEEQISSVKFLAEAGITLLRDSVALVNDSFYIVGRDDKTNPHRKALSDLVAPLDPSKPILLLDHQPEHLEQAQEAGIDFQLSGHTHRGQVFPLNLITDAIFEVSHGYKQKGNTHIYVSSGIGIWGGKFRIGTQSEYLVLELSGKP